MPDEAPDVYADQFLISTNIWGVALSFRRTPPHPTPGQPPQSEPQAIVRMSLEHAKIMAMMMRRQLMQWERENVEIGIPHNVYNQLGLSPEDWIPPSRPDA